MNVIARIVLPVAAGMLLLALGVAALRAGDEYRSALITQQAHVDATGIVTSIQAQLLDIETALRELPANVDNIGAGALTRIEGMTWIRDGRNVSWLPDDRPQDPILLAQVEAAAAPSVTAPLTSATGRDLVLVKVPRAGGYAALTFPVDTLIGVVDSEALLLESLAVSVASADAEAAPEIIFRASQNHETPAHEAGFPVPGDRWTLHYTSTASLRSEELGWALYVLIAMLAYLLAITVHRLQRQPRVLRGDLDRLNQRFVRLNEELAAAVQNRDRAQDRIYQLSVTDTETGLPNRQALTTRLDELFSERREAGVSSPVTVVVLGLRDVENAEHTLGHSVVPAVLPEMARRLSEHLGESDYIARTNNYQLTVLLPDCDTGGAVARVSKWSESIITGIYEHKFGNINVSPLFGIATAEDSYSFAERLLEDAMSALSDAEASTSRWSVFRSDSRDDRASRIQLESDFKSAIENNEFRLYFQPIVQTLTGKPRGFECLVRWQHPIEGLLPPGRFIELGESTGLITELTRWELREAVRQAQSWDNLHRLGCYLSINLSPYDLLYPHLVEELSTLVREARLSPSSFRLEITESMVINNVSQTRNMLNELRDEGFGIMMDDFGTGFSSLSYLRQLPFSAVKIDRSFTQAITWDTKDFGLVRNIVNLVHFLDMETIIEGVETTEQHDMLKTLEPVYCQGYLFSKPMPAIDAEEYLLGHLPTAKPAVTAGR